MHCVHSQNSVQRPEGYQKGTITRHRVQPGRSSGQPRRTVDELDLKKDYRYGNNHDCITIIICFDMTKINAVSIHFSKNAEVDKCG
jgi:hypothetical protein